MEEVKDRIFRFAPFFSPPAGNNGISVLFCLTGVSTVMYLYLMKLVGKSWVEKCLFVCKTSHFCEFLKRRAKTSFLSTISCSFPVFLNMSECNQSSLGSTQVWRESYCSSALHLSLITRKWGWITLFCSIYFPGTLTTLGFLLPLEHTSSGTHQWKPSISSVVPAGSLKNSKLNPNKTSSNSNLLF